VVGDVPFDIRARCEVLSLLALLAQKYKYTDTRARCEAPNMEASDVTVTGPLSAQRVAYNPHWARTLGFWNLTDRATFVRAFARKRAAVQVFFFFGVFCKGVVFQVFFLGAGTLAAPSASVFVLLYW
jgi:hypothetical protein